MMVWAISSTKRGPGARVVDQDEVDLVADEPVVVDDRTARRSTICDDRGRVRDVVEARPGGERVHAVVLRVVHGPDAVLGVDRVGHLADAGETGAAR